MRSFFAALVASTAFASASVAADIAAKPYTKAPAAIPGVNWTGFYIGGGGGYGLWNADTHSVATGLQTGRELTTSGSGYFATVSGGFDWQFHPSWVLGVFGDAQFGDLNGAIVDRSFQSSVDAKSTERYAVGGRLGYLVAPNVLTYVNAGYAHTKYTAGKLSRTGIVIVPDAEYDGWFVGGGVENSLNFFGINAPGWFLKSEYRVSEYDRKLVGYPALGPTSGLSFKPIEQTFTTQLVYRFGAGAASTTRSAPAAAPVNWTGMYVGGGGGYGLFDANTFSTGANEQYRVGGRDYFGTVSGGFDWQFHPSWVAGVFGDAQFGDIKGDIFLLNRLESGSLNNNRSYAAGARLGYLVAPNVLSYVNAGYSHAEFQGGNLVDASTGVPAGSSLPAITRDGYFIGSGVEHSLDLFGLTAPGWFVKSEYRYAKYDMTSVLRAGGGTPEFVFVKPAVQTISTSLVYRFNWGGPVVANY